MAQSLGQSTMIQHQTRHRFSVEDYHRMGETGILGEDERVELIDGEIISMSPIGRRHVGRVIRLTRVFMEGLGRRATLSPQNPVRVGEHSEPQPDVVLLRPRADDYADGLPAPGDVLLIVEVADSSFGFDRDVKAPLYARAGIPEYWIWDVSTGDVTVYRVPGPDGYRETVVVGVGGVLHPAAFPDLAVPVDEM